MQKSQLTEVKNAILNLNLFLLHTRHAILVVALKLKTNYDAKVMKGTCGAYIKVILFSGLLHTLRLFWKTVTYKQMHVIQELSGVS